MIYLSRTGRKVLPGDEVAIAEEYISGEGTYEADGRIYASAVGELDLDTSEKTARVILENPPVVLMDGDVVFADVTDTKPAMAICSVVAQEGKKRSISSETLASVHVSKIASSYVEDAGDLLRAGDLVRAQVIQAEPSVQLTTSGPHFGVIRALCTVCRTPLERKGRDLWCTRCEHDERRKLADDYREFELTKPKH
ncbi:MAG: exosome complex RNA-binding protein Csl4 [Thermoplasmata archaeon]|nr:exosome complex RNA-binding protein Csl4 [Thermoplasmata archaeon]